MKTYICDICQAVIPDPYKVKMREFYIGAAFYEYCCLPEKMKRKTKIHLCGDCFENFRMIIKEKRNG